MCGKVGGKGLWAALDCVGGETTRAVSAATRPGGSVIMYGALAGPTLQLNILDVFLGKKLQVKISTQTFHWHCSIMLPTGACQVQQHTSAKVTFKAVRGRSGALLRASQIMPSQHREIL